MAPTLTSYALFLAYFMFHSPISTSYWKVSQVLFISYVIVANTNHNKLSFLSQNPEKAGVHLE